MYTGNGTGFDKNGLGLFYYLGTIAANKFAIKSNVINQNPTSTWINPHSAGVIQVSMSSVQNEYLSQPSHVVEHPPIGYNCTGSNNLEIDQF